ncbi:hypothetical protein ACIBG8_42935 [Nonomuraea sp. NPDC050556]|uniref:hypothetical protein n=1 Tax=Nonomuraea sp. NPDC050556 TaxID=3364369 RepID=UPI0037BC3425
MAPRPAHAQTDREPAAGDPAAPVRGAQTTQAPKDPVAVLGNQHLQQTAKPDERPLSQLRTIAFEAIDNYRGAAQNGVADAVSTVSDTGWSAWAAALAGNLIWALACFETGGAAFIISLGGIAVGAVGTLPKNGPAFVKWASDHLITAVTDHMGAQVDRVTRDALGTITAEGWADSRVRMMILQRLLKPEYIMLLSGGIPTADVARIRDLIHAELLIRANRQVADPYPMQNPGIVRLNYRVDGHLPRGYAEGDRVGPVENWAFEFLSAELSMDVGGTAAVQALKKEKTLKTAETPFIKVVILDSAMGGHAVLVLDGQNRFFRESHNVGFRGIDGPAVLARMWRSTNGKPPDIDMDSLK